MKAGFGTGAAPEPGSPSHPAPFTPPSVEDMGKLFPQFEIAELLGRGGMGAVYKARQPILDRWVALKVLPPESTSRAGFTERFNREARALARLNHPNIVAVHEFGQAAGMPFFVMEYVEGVTLRQLVRERRLDPREALRIVPQICEALQFAHDEGVVHRDIKPENILLDKKGRVKIADFGIAKLVRDPSEDVSASGGKEPGAADVSPQPIDRSTAQAGLTAEQVLGTPEYMAPEQVAKPASVDHRADIYSLGVVFYEMLTGELPVGKFQPPSKKVQVDVRLDEVVLHTLEKEPSRRYQKASQVKTDLETIAGTAAGPGASGLPENLLTAIGRYKVQAPAISMMIVAVLNYVALAILVVSQNTGVPTVSLMLMVLLHGLVLIGANQMRRGKTYGLAVTASILVMLLPPACFIGLPLGIWSLVVLSRREVRTSFGIPQLPLPTGTPPARATGSGWTKVIAVVAIAAVTFFILVPIGGILLSITLTYLARQRAPVNVLPISPMTALLMSSFGPENEVTLNDLDENRGGEFLDLDEGKTFDVTLAFEKLPRDQQAKWIQDQGVDLMLDQVSRWGLITHQSNATRLVLITNSNWETVSDKDFERALNRADPGLETISRADIRVYLMETNPVLPLTFAFETANGARGLLQVTAFNSKPNSAHLRFKRAPAAAGTAMSAKNDTSPADPPLVRAKPGEYKLTLSNDVVVEVVAVTRDPASNGSWWRPDGSLLSQPPGGRLVFHLAGMSKQSDIDETTHALMVRCEFSPDAAPGGKRQYRAEYTPRPQRLGQAEILRSDLVTEATESVKRLARMATGSAGGPPARGIVGYADVLRFPDGTKTATVQCATATGPWEAVAIFDRQQTRVLVEGMQVLCTHLREESNRKCLDVTHNVDRDRYALRMMGVFKDGTRQELALHSGVLAARETQGFVMLEPGQRVQDITEFVLERTPWVRGEIGNITLRPESPQAEAEASPAAGKAP